MNIVIYGRLHSEVNMIAQKWAPSYGYLSKL